MAYKAESLLKTEQATFERMAPQLHRLESDKETLRADLGVFDRLPPPTDEGLQLHGLQADAKAPSQLRYQMLAVQNGKGNAGFKGR